MESSRIFVRGLPPSLSAENFKAHFSKQSTITDAKVIPHRRIGYVGYKSPKDAAQAVKYHNKTFIRMSRIGVELARSVEEQYALRSGTDATNGVKRKYSDTNDDIAKQITPDAHDRQNGRALKGGEGNIKLQEFLEVMQPPSRSKKWETQVATTAQTPIEPVLPPQITRVADTRSDGEYEPAFKKQKKEQKCSGKEKQNDESIQREEVLRKHPTPELSSTTQAPSDVDWLRSRTSRILGLVDDDDALDTIGPTDDHQEQKTTAAEPFRHVESGNTSDVSVQTDRETHEEILIRGSELSPGIEDTAVGNGRLFIRNLTYTINEHDLRQHFESGGYGTIEELHLPVDSRSGNNKGFAHVQYAEPEAAAKALRNLDRRPLQGRLLHIMPANAKKETGLDEFAISKLPLKKQQQIQRRAEAASSTFNWNSMYMNSDAVMSSTSDRLGVSKSELLDPTSAAAAVKQAHAETHIIQETRSYFTANGVDLDTFKRKERGDTAILVKNFSYGTKPEELKKLFEPHGHISRLLMPPSGTIAIVEFEQPDHTRSAFGTLAYRKFKDSILFLEKAPKGLFGDNSVCQEVSSAKVQGTKLLAKDLLEKDPPQQSVHTSTLFVRNLNFSTNTERLREIFQPLKGFLSARVKTRPDSKKPGQLLSMGFGFLEFETKENAQAAMAAMDGYKLEGHELLIRLSHRTADAAEERRREDQAKKAAGKRTKIIIKNLPFETSRKDVRSLFEAYGQLRSVRVPKKFDSSTRGFAFAEFVTAREAENAMDALRNTHLLGRRLVLDFAAEDAIDPEQEIEKMQQRVGKQADKVALQRLTGSARKKFNVEGGDELDQG